MEALLEGRLTVWVVCEGPDRVGARMDEVYGLIEGRRDLEGKSGRALDDLLGVLTRGCEVGIELEFAH